MQGVPQATHTHELKVVVLGQAVGVHRISQHGWLKR